MYIFLKISVINLFDLGRRYQQGEPDYYINEYINRHYETSVKPSNATNNSQAPKNNNSNNKNINSIITNMNLKEESFLQVEEEKAIFSLETGRTNLNINLNNLN